MTARALSLVVAALVACAASSAPGANLADREGRWTCRPTTPKAPLIEIDFEEAEYRRCDQLICSAFDLSSSEADLDIGPDRIEIGFAPLSHFSAALDGSDFVETITRGTLRYRSVGRCTPQDEAKPKP